jgi:hypothetical protein
MQAAQKTDLDPSFLEHLIDTIVIAMPEYGVPFSTIRDAACLALLALKPANPFQGMLAVQVIVAHYGIMDCFRRAADPMLPAATAARLRANAVALSRNMRTTLQTLQQQQAAATDQEPAPPPAPSVRASTRPAKPAPTFPLDSTLIVPGLASLPQPGAPQSAASLIALQSGLANGNKRPSQPPATAVAR